MYYCYIIRSLKDGSFYIVPNDYLLTTIYIVIIVIAFLFKKEKNDLLVLTFGFFIMIVSESLFISTGVETFNRVTLFGLMPLWLPILWAYGFVAVKRSVLMLSA
ncbi:MAG: hypothetical protein A3H57_03515 [Candidatus Taylorbacteria bacterium RIFCSPLOWO2_02_FULL_43_11]|uniref:Uncharacterized protein n=1 Tax=Candidatus Taylorbacteria bacterium RIFCSPHIGHO2_02_FULL_43_32b TaxID=1802306 RepID=A0A1G2MMC7_9BACT|nr:MAG: hypothetical protein A3C72_02170 [Candidatus Taylorbacteria bacterium RIFCSPHIGHO2_02_FULL_43_32b]OHA31703.1 MAG: hypothetical protein A3B08_01895 [Candidatus Taylorbacteria bacterium RIFCSPLOWO2_01_FULL_43_44]OHA36617.1 MAG: hypothetical protein A3H57_03515 [Candidatus Taylorbacteria bacterium RIFCSPLOWO2_02_FULL_43_11]